MGPEGDGVTNDAAGRGVPPRPLWEGPIELPSYPCQPKYHHHLTSSRITTEIVTSM
jgi:hypothetical protein